MKSLSFSDLIEAVRPRESALKEDQGVSILSFDSRKLIGLPGTVFFAIEGKSRNGHDYISEAHHKGCRQFVVADVGHLPAEIKSTANWMVVENVVETLQTVARLHREQFDLPVIAITGSNGKTIVKEWLSQLLAGGMKVVKSPRSYNSQIGVPLSLWQISSRDEVAVIEAGISEMGEMIRLEQMIRPTVGILTNIGAAHDAGFETREIKASEKLMLFQHCEKLIYCMDHPLVVKALEGFQQSHPDVSCIGWSLQRKVGNYQCSIIDSKLLVNDFSFDCPFTEPASLENLLHCIVAALEMGLSVEEVGLGLKNLEPVAMRLELKKGVDGSYLIDDSYSNDLAGLKIALDFMVQQGGSRKRTVILTDILQSSMDEGALYDEVATLLSQHSIDELLAVGPAMGHHQPQFSGMHATFYPTVASLLDQLRRRTFVNRMILVKGARSFEMERVVHQLQEKTHGTRLEVNLNAIIDNLSFYRNLVPPETKLMVMVKALAYGGGSYEIASALAYHRVDYLAVAYVDEGIDLRRMGIKMPIMVMNVGPESMARLLENDLEPEVYSIKQLQELLRISSGELCRVHLKIDTGMHRLGFGIKDMDRVIALIKENRHLEVVSMFTHLAASDDPKQDDFTRSQVEMFNTIHARVSKETGRKPIRHVLNSAGITRFPQYQFEMVRLGIGLYGIDAQPEVQKNLQPVSTLKTSLSQIIDIDKGDTVGYNRAFRADRPTTIGTLSLGYADGYDRRFGNGVGRVLIGGSLVPVVGHVCMDMTMVDITGLEVKEGDEAIVFGADQPVTTLARNIGTIPYEILTNISSRVKRIFFQD